MKKLYLVTAILAVATVGKAQIKLGSNINSVDPAAVLELENANKAFYLSRVSLTATTDVTTVPNPKAGMIVYNTNTAITGTMTYPAASAGSGLYCYSGAAWVPASMAASWGLTGNSGNVAGTNFLGNTDDVPLSFRVNNIKSGNIDGNNGIGNTSFGYQSQLSTTPNTGTGAGSFNTSVGAFTLQQSTTGRRNSAFGYAALGANTSGDSNTAAGYGALAANTLGFNNTAFGAQSLDHNTTGKYNTANGYLALHSNQSDSGLTAIGAYALYNNNGGKGNTATGFTALYANFSGTGNTANGFFALRSSLLANNNTAMGFAAGARSGSFGIGGNSNVFIGFAADSSNTTSSGITAVGAQAGINNTGSNNTFLGNNAVGSTGNLTYATAIGSNAVVCSSNSLALGASDAGASTVQSVNLGINVCDPTQRIDFRNGHIRNRQDNLPAISIPVANGVTAAAINAGGSDVRGIVTTTGYNNLSAVTTIRIDFAYAATNAPIVTVTPANENASLSYWYVTSDVSGFSISYRSPYTGVAPSGPAPSFTYHVIE